MFRFFCLQTTERQSGPSRAETGQYLHQNHSWRHFYVLHQSIMALPSRKRVLNVGLACLDIVMVCSSYPEEDSDERCLSHEWRRGGNASNNCTIFSEFQVPCEYLGTLSSDHGGKYLKDSFIACGIPIDHCVYYDGCECPTSVVLINSQNGSRTIIHSNRNLPELTLVEFKKIDLLNYKWIHFEGRSSVSDIAEMIAWIRQWNTNCKSADAITVSVEIEKPRASFKVLLPLGDIVFISKDFAKFCGYESMESAVEGLVTQLNLGSSLICAWGDKGACVKSNGGETVVIPASVPECIVDTLGAGDTFITSVISSLTSGNLLAEAVRLGCQIAGVKCGMQGFQGLLSISQDIQKQ